MSTGDDIPDRRERCECGAWDEDHEDACENCREAWHARNPNARMDDGECPGGRRILQVFCPSRSGEFRRAVRPSYDD